MIEMLGVLAIVGVLSAGGIAGYSMAMQSYKTNQLIEKVNLIATRVRSVYKGDYRNGVSNDNMISSGKLSADDFKNPFGDDMLVRRADWEENTTFLISIEGNLPADTCTDLLLMDWGNKGVFEGVRVISDADRNARYRSGTWPVSADTAIAWCKEGATIFRIIFK